MIVSRVAVCLPKDRSTDDGRYDDVERCIAPGGGWLIDALKPRFADASISIERLEARQYWSMELSADDVNLRLTINHIFPFACSAWLLTRRRFFDRLRLIDHAVPSERVFDLICDVMRADSRAGRVLSWRGGLDPNDQARFVRESTKELNGGVPMPGVVRLPPER